MVLADTDRVYELDKASFSLPWTLKAYQYEVRDNAYARNWVMELSGAGIIGFIVVWHVLDEAHIGTVAIDEKFRSKGLGKLLTAYALIKSAEEGMTTSYLEVRRSNLQAQGVYEALGYRSVGLRARYYQDNHEDALLMTLEPIDADILRRIIAEINPPEIGSSI